jgi:hypothetical protein
MRKYWLAACAAALASSFLLAAAPADAAVQVPATAVHLAGASQSARPAQNFEAYYDFATETTSGPSCLNLVVTANWSDYGCRNIDEAFANLLTVAVCYPPFNMNTGRHWLWTWDI